MSVNLDMMLAAQDHKVFRQLVPESLIREMVRIELREGWASMAKTIHVLTCPICSG